MGSTVMLLLLDFSLVPKAFKGWAFSLPLEEFIPGGSSCPLQIRELWLVSQGRPLFPFMLQILPKGSDSFRAMGSLKAGFPYLLPFFLIMGT